MCQPGPCVRALREAVAVLLSKNMTCARPGCNARPSKHFPHTSHCTLHTLHFALHACTSSQLISSELFSSHFMSSHMSAKFFLSVLQRLHKALSSTTLYYKACTKHFPVLLCTTQLAQSTSQYYFVPQSLHKALPSTALYYTACTKHFPVLLCTTKLAQTTSQYYYCVLLLCTTKLAQTTSQQYFVLHKACTQYYFVQQSLQKVVPSTTLYYKV